MGQGHYQTIGYGVLGDPIGVDEDGELPAWFYEVEREIKEVHGIRLRTGYEAKPNYLAFLMLCSDSCLAEEWGAIEISYRAMTLDTLRIECAASLEKVRLAWAMLHSACRVHGVTLPTPELLFIADYD